MYGPKRPRRICSSGSWSKVRSTRLASSVRLASINSMARLSVTAAGASSLGMDTYLLSWRTYGPKRPMPTLTSLSSKVPSVRGKSNRWRASSRVMVSRLCPLSSEAKRGLLSLSLLPIWTRGPNRPILTLTGSPDAGSVPNNRSPTLCSRRMSMTSSTLG